MTSEGGSNSRVKYAAGKKWALVTGASAGIGEAFCHVLALHGFNVVLVARREEKLKRIEEALQQSYSIQTKVVVADLASINTPRHIYEELKREKIPISILVNNAGYAIKGAFIEASWLTHQEFLQVMANSVAEMCYLFSKDMVENSYGRIINVSSLAAYAPQNSGSLYGPVKSFVLALSQALHMELSSKNVHCLALCPGFTRSEFHEVMDVTKATDRLPGFMWKSAHEVAQEGFDAVMEGRYVLINGWFNRFIAVLLALIPDKILNRFASNNNFFD